MGRSEKIAVTRKKRARAVPPAGNKLLYNSPAYKKWRLSVYKRDKFTCRLCGDKGKALNAHHILQKAKYPELIYDKNNGITLCEACHLAVTTRETVFSDLFTKILNKKLTQEYVYSLFNMISTMFPECMKIFKENNKWLKIPVMLVTQMLRQKKQ